MSGLESLLAELPLHEAEHTPGNVTRTGRVSLAGRSYLLDPTKGFIRQTLDMRKASQDQGSTPGQQTLTDAGLWHRSQTDWSLGARQRHFDRADSNPRRYWTSKGVDPWTPGELGLLNDTTRILASTESNLHCVGVGRYLYVTDSTSLRRTTDGATWVTISVGSRPKSITTDGAFVYVITDAGIYKTLVGSSLLSLHASTVSTFSGDVIAYANGRLIAADGARIVEVDSDGNAGGDGVLDFTHPNPSFQWTSVTSAPNAIYAAGYAGDRALIYAIGVNTNTGGLRVPTFACAIPDGETVNVIAEYGSLVIIGTSRGVRCGQITGNAAIAIGPVIEIPGGVHCFEPQGEYVWGSWSNYDSASTGLFRLSLAELTAPLVPAYSSDLMAETQGRVVGAATFGNLRFFTVAGSGVWAEQANTPVATGTLDGGSIEWNTFATKTAAAFDLRHEPLAGTVTAYTVDEHGVSRAAGISAASSSLGPSVPFEMSDVHGESVHPVVVLASDGDTAPTLRRWTVSAVVRPKRQDVYVLPLQFYSNLTDRYGVAESMDVVEEMAFLKSLEATGQVVPMVLGADTRRVQIDRIVQQEPTDWNEYLTGFEGIVLVQVITQEAGI